MRRVKIFLASSIEDLWEDRLQVGDFFRQLNEIYLDRGIHFSLIKCEDYNNSIAADGKQQEYDAEIRESELVFFLFFRKVGDYTRHEFEVALEAFKNRKKPRIITYFKYISGIEDAVQEVRDFMQLLDREIKHYYNTYGHIDTLKLGILMQIKLLQLDSAQIKLENGEVRLNGQVVVKAENVPLLYGNQSLREQNEKRRQLQAKLDTLRVEFLADPTPEKEAAFFDTSAELNRVSRHLTAVEQETMALLTTVAEMTSDGRVLTHRQKEALKYFNQGDYAVVHAILEDVERENELRRAQSQSEAAKNEIRGYVEEELLLIKTEKAQGLTEARVKRILAGYQKVAELVEKHDLKKTALYDYAVFLEAQNQYAQAIAVAEKLRWHYAEPSSKMEEEDEGLLYNLLGILYQKTRRFAEAEKAYGKALDIYTGLTVCKPEVYEPALAVLCNNLGILYKDTQRYKDAEQAYGKALEILTRLADQNPEAYEPDLSMSYSNMGNLYQNTHRYGAAADAHGKALQIRICLAARNPNAYEPDLAGSYNNLGNLHRTTHCYQEAADAYGKALEIRTRMAIRNPEVYEPELAVSYNNLGVLYQETRIYEAAEEFLGEAIKILTRLADRSPEAYEPDLASSLNNMGNLFSDTQRYAEAEEFYCRAAEVYERLAVRSPEVYEPALAMIYNNLGALYGGTQRYKAAEKAFVKVLEIFDRLAVKNPDAYEKNLAESYNNLGILYRRALRYEEAQRACSKALEIGVRLTTRNPDAYGPGLADTLWNMVLLYDAQELEEKLLEVLRAAQPLYEELAIKYPGRYQEKAELIGRILRGE